MITFPRLEAMCRGVIPFCREINTCSSDGKGERSVDTRYLSNDSYSLYLWGEVDIGSSIEQQLSHIQVFIVCSNVEGRKSSLPGHIRERKLEQLIYSISILFIITSHVYQYQ